MKPTYVSVLMLLLMAGPSFCVGFQWGARAKSTASFVIPSGIITVDVFKPHHGFKLGDGITFTTKGTIIRAYAFTGTELIGVVTEVGDSDNFAFKMAGPFRISANK